ncbi:GIY-YIG nuclease family protein [Candidatus Chromulinivorax destructor]|uniref:Excinuclease ABC subunit C n=1 Tax=Candidatus Chromulinivorax destructor TaxID=2066483 RepID=A0A345ZBZ3_9BACT|nr:GIY-YIG nuclease family protein [Candidatus Chromulinivorax destructor]AXK60810.1 hypothetical protein C0J27_03625 [Candidatus Chromulinivorax destructor]
MINNKALRDKYYPKDSGVYFFKDANNGILYIGKAKNLKNRINSYFSSIDDKAIDLVRHAVDIEYIITNNEIEALFLEAQLVKKHQPPYNRLLKSGNPFVYIFFSQDTIPTISIVRTKKKKGEYFGPFLTKKDALHLVSYLKNRFQLNICGKKIQSGCLQFHINICAGSCKPDFDLEFYLFRLQIARQLLQHEYKEALHYLESELVKSNLDLNFERSKHLVAYRHHLQAIVDTLTILKKTKFTNIKEPSIDKNISNVNLLSDLKIRLNLSRIPYRIDCFDISHMQSQSIVGSCVRFLDGKPDKKNFRHFMIKSLIIQNDYAALEEIVTRRYRKPEDYPDLIIIDGGKGQLNATKHLAGPAEIVSLAKREETIFFGNGNEPIILDIQKETDRLILQIRDYAHHFAVSYHRKKQKLTADS